MSDLRWCPHGILGDKSPCMPGEGPCCQECAKEPAAVLHRAHNHPEFHGDVEGTCLSCAFEAGSAAERARILEVLGNTANHARTADTFKVLMAVKEYIESGAHVKDGEERLKASGTAK